MIFSVTLWEFSMDGYIRRAFTENQPSKSLKEKVDNEPETVAVEVYKPSDVPVRLTVKPGNAADEEKKFQQLVGFCVIYCASV